MERLWAVRVSAWVQDRQLDAILNLQHRDDRTSGRVGHGILLMSGKRRPPEGRTLDCGERLSPRSTFSLPVWLFRPE